MQHGQPMGRCPFLLGGRGSALVAAQIPSFSLGHVGGEACSGWWCWLPFVPVGVPLVSSDVGSVPEGT